MHSWRFWFSAYTETETFPPDQLPELVVKAAECNLVLLKGRDGCQKAERDWQSAVIIRLAGQWPHLSLDETSGTDPEIVAKLNQEPMAWGRSVIKPGMPVSKSGLSMVATTRVRHSPVITRQVHGDKVGPRSSQEVRPYVRINKVHGQAEAQLWQHWK